MKKTLCIFLSFLILITSFLALPVSSQAATYKPDRKIQMQAAMRYAGPRMLWHHPIAAIRHMMNEW